MAYEQKDNSGSLFVNEKKETDKHPDLTGSVTIGGINYWISAWTKKSEKGKKWLSLAFKLKDQPHVEPDDLPFP